MQAVKVSLWCGLLPWLALVSCERTGEALGKLRREAGSLLGKKDDGGAEASLAALVERGPEGVRFRRDLPFPDPVSASVSTRTVYANGRGASRSALGVSSTALEGPFERVVRFERRGGRVTMIVEKSGKVVEPPEGGKAPPPEPSEEDEGPRLVGRSLALVYTKSGWKAPETAGPVDFRQRSWGRQVASGAPDLLVEAGLFPRPLWFPEGRMWKEGDELVLSGKALALLQAGRVSGDVKLVFEGEEAVAGHPCVRFAVEGELTVKDEPQEDGSRHSFEMSIASGRIWCSLLYPVILKEDFDAVQSAESAGPGGVRTRYQGGVKLVRVRTWERG